MTLIQPTWFNNNMNKFVSKSAKTLLNALGVFDAVRFINNRSVRVPILLYHIIRQNLRSNTGRTSFSLKNLAVSSKNFEAQIRYLTKKYKVISLYDYMKKRSIAQDLSGCAVVTFDDGFKECFTVALDVLRKYSCPATVFLSSSFQEKIYWRHKLYFILDYSCKIDYYFKINSDTAIIISLATDKEKEKTLRLLVNILEKFTITEIELILDKLENELGQARKVNPEEVYLTAEDITFILKAGMDIGAHSATHSDLSVLAISDYQKEIAGSIEYIRDLTRDKTNSVLFSLPLGRYNEEILNYLKSKNVLCSLTGESGLNTVSEDSFKLKRVSVPECSLAEFKYLLTGVSIFAYGKRR